MKAAIAFTVFLALMIAPVACAIVTCPAIETHDCCPKSKSFAACPFDILMSAKAALPAVAGVLLDRIVIPMEPFVPLEPASVLPGGGLYLQNRVLRI